MLAVPTMTDCQHTVTKSGKKPFADTTTALFARYGAQSGRTSNEGAATAYLLCSDEG